MLESLTIRNYAIIDEMTVDFSGGLMVITGETGAGKSIIVDAFELVLGARASSEMVRSGADSMSVCAVFNIADSHIEDTIPFETDHGILILRREVRADGTGKCFINDSPVTLKVLKELGDLLVDLHGQHDHQSLLNVAEHVRLLDGFGGISGLAAEVTHIYNEMVNFQRKIGELHAKLDNLTRDRELHRFQIDEIESANIAPGEDSMLSEELKRLSRAVELKALGFEIFEKLSESEDSVSIHLGELATKTEHLSRYDQKLGSFLEKFEELSVGLSDLSNSFREYAEKINNDSGTIAETEERLGLIEKLKKKYGPACDDVFEYLAKIKQETAGVEEIEHKLANLEQREREITMKLAEQAGTLSRKRKAAAPQLSREVEAHLSELGMDGARLVIRLEQYEGPDSVPVDGCDMAVGRDGFDRMEFLVSTNPGEPPKPLVKVASGGEISRIMLAMKLALADVAQVPTMVFDEIDNGVSGRVAEAVGRKMRQLSGLRQVLTITHLPQIAVMADCHFSARKTVRDGRTHTELVRLDEQARQLELASLLSGEKMPDTALAHARELMKKAGNRNKLNNNK